MKEKLKRLFTNHWFLAALGLLLVALIIWFVGDAIAFYNMRPLESAASRLTLILLVVLAWAAFEGWKKYRDWRANKQMLAALAQGDDHNQNLSAKEVADLKQRFELAMTTLRAARFENKSLGGKSYLYQLPWYVFIGAPGSGKTTALINSGLRFPLAEKFGKDAVKGVGGTRNCDWWFTDEAVLLDTAGRYSTQTSNQEVDSAAWMGFVKLLKKFRPQQPLNGAIITLSVFDLMTQTAAERADYGRAIRQRVQELYGTLGHRFPLYVMVTKSDLLAGFMEFFSDLGREERGQAWGITFDYHPETGGASPLEQFNREFSALEARVNARLFARMEDERDQQRRALAYAFPQQFSSMGPLIAAFLAEVFGNSAFEEQALLRGVYFTSGTQEGSPFDRVLGSLSRAFGMERQVLPPASSSGKSYFITRLLREVVFVESDLTGRSEKVEQKHRRLLMIGYAALGVFSLALIAGWMLSYFRNQTLVAEVEAQATELKTQAARLPPVHQGGITDLLPLLNGVRDLPAGYARREQDAPLSLSLGLYQGHKLGAQSATAYLNLLRDAFLPRIGLRLEQQMQAATSPEIRYEALKAYLMLYDAKHLDVGALEAWIKADWQRTLGREVSETDRTNLAYHLRAALSVQPLAMIVPINKPLVAEARAQLAASPLPERAYSRLRLLGAASDIPAFRLSDAAGPSAPLVFARASGAPLTQSLPGLYTMKGYKQAFSSDAPDVVKHLVEEESWVLGPQYASVNPPDGRRVLSEVQNLYLNDYINKWDELLGDLRLAPARDLQQSIQAITLLAAGDSPLKRLLVAVSRETQLAASMATTPQAQAEKAAGKVVDNLRKTVDRILGDTPQVAAAAATERPEAVVDRHFEQLNKLVAAAPGTPAAIDAVLEILKQYEIQLRATDDAIKRGMPPQSDAMLTARIKSEADRLPPPLRNLLNGLITRSTNQAAVVTQQGIQKAVAGGVGTFCKQAIEGRYPLARGSTREVALGDFSRLFGPGGQLDAFFRANLQTLVDTSGSNWKPIKLAEGVSSVSPAVVAQFQRANNVREAFFSGGSPNASATADLVLIRLDEGIGQATLVYEGQTTHFTNGRPGAVRLVWPSLNPASQAKMTAVLAGSTPTLASEGPWAIFRLLDQARWEGAQSDRQKLTFDFSGRKAQFELRANSVRNPFRLRDLEQFRCPS